MTLKYIGMGLRYIRNLSRISFGVEPVLERTVLARDPSILGKSTVYGVDKDNNYWRVPDRKSRLIKFTRDPLPLSYPSMQGHVNLEYSTGTLFEWRPVRKNRVPEEVKQALNGPDSVNPFDYIEARDPCIAIF